MKSLTKLHYLFLAAALAVGFASCDSDDDGPEEPEKPLYNVNDVEALREIFTYNGEIYGSWGDNTQAILEDPSLWGKYVVWDWDEEAQEYRCIEVILVNQFYTGNVPDAIGRLDKLLALQVHGFKYVGGIPESVCNLENLIYLDISGTSLSCMTDDIFTDKMIYVYISNNPDMVELPSSVTKLKTKNYLFDWSKLQYFDLAYNAFEGRCPAILNANVDLQWNNLSEFAWEMCGGTPHPENGGIGKEGRTIVSLTNNNLKKCAIPEPYMEKMWADTLGMIIFKSQTHDDDRSDIFSNFPKDSEFDRIRIEFYTNNPEMMPPGYNGVPRKPGMNRENLFTPFGKKDKPQGRSEDEKIEGNFILKQLNYIK